MTESTRQLHGRIALVEDHVRLSLLVKRGLAGIGIAADVFPTLASAWHAVGDQPYAVVVVDRGLPDGDGLELVRWMRAAGNTTPCLMLTARDALHDRVDGLDAGADDYLAKPFAIEELAARVRALMRRPAELRDPRLAHDDLRLRPEDGRLCRGDESVSLAPAELQIMICLLRAAGQAVRRGTLEAAAWGMGDAVTPNALDVALHRLRRKLAAIESRQALVNLRAHGYALRAGDAPAPP